MEDGRKRKHRRPELYGVPKGRRARFNANRVPGLRKTVICKDWYCFGIRGCRHGDDCSYAHGDDELQPVPTHFVRAEGLGDPYASAEGYRERGRAERLAAELPG